MGFLHVVTGPMFSGKTSRLIELYHEHKTKTTNILIFNHILDTRYNKEPFITTHNLETVKCVQIDNLYEICDHPDYSKCVVIIIDEGQFFANIKGPILKMVETDNKLVIIGGLLLDTKRCPFGELINIIPFADKHEQKFSKCYYCNNMKGLFTMRKFEFIKPIDVGSSDKYMTVCRKHYFK